VVKLERKKSKRVHKKYGIIMISERTKEEKN
jgi:hypothetical protein